MCSSSCNNFYYIQWISNPKGYQDVGKIIKVPSPWLVDCLNYCWGDWYITGWVNPLSCPTRIDRLLLSRADNTFCFSNAQGQWSEGGIASKALRDQYAAILLPAKFILYWKKPLLKGSLTYITTCGNQITISVQKHLENFSLKLFKVKQVK